MNKLPPYDSLERVVLAKFNRGLGKYKKRGEPVVITSKGEEISVFMPCGGVKHFGMFSDYIHPVLYKDKQQTREVE